MVVAASEMRGVPMGPSIDDRRVPKGSGVALECCDRKRSDFKVQGCHECGCV